jgi:two-component system response regulator FlrC
MRSAVQGRPVLVVDDEPTMRVALAESLRVMGYPTVLATGPREALAQCRAQPVALVITDMKMPEMSGLDLFSEMRKQKIEVPVVLMSAFGTVEVAVSAMKAGIVDYLPKPFSQEALAETLRRALPKSEVPTPVQGCVTGERVFLTQDEATLETLRQAEIVAASDVSVLIEGESGTGKEWVARTIHEKSPRAGRPFVAVNCAAVPDGLLESELFGHERGAFTGAVNKKLGRFELAHTGTLLLDEVSELPLLLQAKLLRVIQEREVDLLGGRAPIPVDIRVVATSNRPLFDEVKAGRFRADLYYRLSVFPLRLTPLRARLGDVPMLATHFVQRAASRHRRGTLTVSPSVFPILSAQPWPGNVRELENVIERAALLAQGEEITPDHLRFDTEAPQTGRVGTLWDVERARILEALQQLGGNRTHAARELGVSLRTLRNKLREYRALPDAPVT